MRTGPDVARGRPVAGVERFLEVRDHQRRASSCVFGPHCSGVTEQATSRPSRTACARFAAGQQRASTGATLTLPGVISIQPDAPAAVATGSSRRWTKRAAAPARSAFSPARSSASAARCRSSLTSLRPPAPGAADVPALLHPPGELVEIRLPVDEVARPPRSVTNRTSNGIMW